MHAENVPNARRRYISHYWRNAQEQCGVLKSLLLTMLPTCKIYVDDDDMEDEEEEIEGQLDQTTAVLVFLTSEYVGSRKCMHELTTAWRLQKPLIVVREADSQHGGLSAKAFESEVEMYVARHLKGSEHVSLSADEQSALAWLQSAAIGGARVTQCSDAPPNQQQGLGGSDVSYVLLPALVVQGSSGTVRSSSSPPCCAR